MCMYLYSFKNHCWENLNHFALNIRISSGAVTVGDINQSRNQIIWIFHDALKTEGVLLLTSN